MIWRGENRRLSTALEPPPWWTVKSEEKTNTGEKRTGCLKVIAVIWIPEIAFTFTCLSRGPSVGRYVSIVPKQEQGSRHEQPDTIAGTKRTPVELQQPAMIFNSNLWSSDCEMAHFDTTGSSAGSAAPGTVTDPSDAAAILDLAKMVHQLSVLVSQLQTVLLQFPAEYRLQSFPKLGTSHLLVPQPVWRCCEQLLSTLFHGKRNQTTESWMSLEPRYKAATSESLPATDPKDDSFSNSPPDPKSKEEPRDTRRTRSRALISDDTSHDSAHACCAVAKIHEWLGDVAPLYAHVTYVSDGAASHFKNRYQLHELTKTKYMSVKRLFSATGHGKNACDEIGGLVKDHGTLFNLRGPTTSAIKRSSDMVDLLKTKLPNVALIHLPRPEVQVSRKMKTRDWDSVRPVSGNQYWDFWQCTRVNPQRHDLLVSRFKNGSVNKEATSEIRLAYTSVCEQCLAKQGRNLTLGPGRRAPLFTNARRRARWSALGCLDV
ncbi:hypothetical protein HPB47_001196 [Ixodes persulcatus]|uniref:Uncharacterized protein n=1 Tax=Ixodes persulcatus TaxID=34615 RepID=A0AC60PR62_IXOPE|nr:hypothetical protein HPB47_001196 [Ixodes persulcatus]